MSYTLVIAEKPSVGKTLAAWLAKTTGKPATTFSSHVQVGDFMVSWLFGHVLENIEPHEYDEKYEIWAAEDLPIIPDRWILKPRDEVDKTTGKKTGRPDPGILAQIKVLKGLLAKATRVIGLGDPDQEGQLLQDELLLWAGCKVPVDRLWLSAVDDASIAKAWKDMKPNSHYEGYYWSALARSHADWLAGINVTRACTLASKANGGNATLSVGRVQTPTLALIVAREHAIRSFRPVDYFTPVIELATMPGFKATWNPDKETDTRLDPLGRLMSKVIAQTISDAAKRTGKVTVTSVAATKGREHAPLPFSLSALQEHMSKKQGMGVVDTLNIAQSLYEKKLATYPRTDSDHLPEAQHVDAPSILKSMAALSLLSAYVAKADASFKSRAFDDKHVTAHHAIVPRPVTAAQLADLTIHERQVWLEIAKRYLLQFFPVAEFQTTEITLECAGEPYKAAGKVYAVRGWKDAFGEPDEDAASPALPPVAKGAVLPLRDATFTSTTTTAPKRFTEGTLVAAMKNVHKYVVDPKFKATLRENVGIGTEATRAKVISELISRKFIEVVKKELKPTTLGEQLIDALPRQLTAPDLTALWQQAMDDIRTTGEPGYARFMDAQQKWLSGLVCEVPKWFAGRSLLVAGKKTGPEVKATSHKCLKCGGALNHVKGPYGWFFGCNNASCKEVYKDVAGKPVAKTPPPTPTAADVIGGYKHGDTCPKCSKGTLNLRVCGADSRAPGMKFLSCSNYYQKGKLQCKHSVWPERAKA